MDKTLWLTFLGHPVYICILPCALGQRERWSAQHRTASSSSIPLCHILIWWQLQGVTKTSVSWPSTIIQLRANAKQSYRPTPCRITQRLLGVSGARTVRQRVLWCKYTDVFSLRLRQIITVYQLIDLIDWSWLFYCCSSTEFIQAAVKRSYCRRLGTSYRKMGQSVSSSSLTYIRRVPVSRMCNVVQDDI